MINQTPEVSSLDPIAQCIFNYKEEAHNARWNRELLNQMNFDCYNMKQDYGHKQRGQSKEFLNKQSMATEQLTSFLQQGLTDQGDWFSIEAEDALKPEDLLITPDEMQKLLQRQLTKNEFNVFYNDKLKLGLLGALMICKIGGKYVKKADFVAKADSNDLAGKKNQLFRQEKDIWQLDLSLVRQEDYYPDPTGRGLYEIQRITIDWYALKAFAKKANEINPGTFDLEAIDNMTPNEDDWQKQKKARETNQNVTYSQYRRVVTFYECWGTLMRQDTGEVLMENCVSAIDLQGRVIRPPKANPFWHNESPFVTCPIIRVPMSVWHKALMDAGTRHNYSLNELYNLMVDGGMMEVYGIKQLHSSWLEDPTQVSNGIAPGTTLLVNSQCPPGGKALERVDTGSLTADGFNMFSLIDREFQSSALTNDSRMGNLPQRAVKATEIVASNQSITGIMNGIVKVIEEKDTSQILRKSWLVMAQHMNDLDSSVVGSIIGEDRARQLASMTKEELFAGTAEKMVYKVFGLSMTLNKIQDFRKIQSLLQSIGGSPQMMQEFMRKYSMTKLLGEIVKSLDIDEDKILTDPQEKAAQQQEAMQQAQMEQMQNGGGGQPQGNTQGGQGSNPQSQIPQMASNRTQDTGISIPRGVNNIGMTNPQ